MARRFLVAAVALATPLVCFGVLTSCGYVGPVLPPSPQIPTPITDLSVIERGDRLVINFTTPPRTVDNLAIRKFSAIDLRVGAPPDPFDEQTWAQKATKIEVAVPPENSPDEARAVPVTDNLPVSDWVGKTVSVMVRSAVKSGNHFSAWSNRVSLDVLPPLAPPTVTIEPTAAGYKLSWPADNTDVSFDILRRGPADKSPALIATVKQGEYTDKTAAWDTPYTYTVVERKGSAESLPSAEKTVNSPDVFPPSVPTELSAFASADSIEVSWKRSPESDLNGYLIYRSVNGGAFEKQGGVVTLPAYSDHAVEHGKTYRYAISAVDRKGNESERSTPVEAVFP